jgi:hypothetical protein
VPEEDIEKCTAMVKGLGGTVLDDVSQVGLAQATVCAALGFGVKTRNRFRSAPISSLGSVPVRSNSWCAPSADSAQCSIACIRTAATLQAGLASGAHIVSLDWLNESNKSRSFMPEKAYVPRVARTAWIRRAPVSTAAGS